MITNIIEIKKDNSILWKYGKNKKTVLNETITAFDGLCAGRGWLPLGFSLENTLGVEKWYQTKDSKIGLSINQMRRYIRHVAKTGRILKRPYKLSSESLEAIEI